MFRLISLLVVVAIMAIMWVTMADRVMGGGGDDCGPAASTTTLPPVSLPAGVAKMLDPC